MAAFFHPLDGLGGWNRLYGAAGFLQYQFVVGDAEATRCAGSSSDSASSGGLVPVRAQAVRPGDPGPLSFPIPGWTLALDLPVGLSGLDRLLDDLDAEVAAAGGRVYLAKDSRLAPETFRTMYPRVDEWLAVRRTGRPRRCAPLRPRPQARDLLGRRPHGSGRADPTEEAGGAQESGHEAGGTEEGRRQELGQRENSGTAPAAAARTGPRERKGT